MSRGPAMNGKDNWRPERQTSYEFQQQ
uniref:Uncharacterized protein n=1 Tax=Arundo donax TaxID=35708 RepID=A0A0A8ZUL7_ARUDO